MGFPDPSGGGIRGIIAFIGIGSNLGNPAERCREAVQTLGMTQGIRLLRSSSLYRTEPVGPQDQPWFVNAAAEIRTILSPRQLLETLREIERKMGRTGGEKWGPRAIDLDILLYGQEVVRDEGMTVPHPELHRRRFVLVPLCELAPYAIHPAFGVSIRGLAERLTEPGRVERIEENEG
jgi:2-amino-4-hydroxy-6-hydroxymethyldihydropteridine diphosphokinase